MNLSEINIITAQFDLKVYLNSAVINDRNEVLHVYIGGDGSPFFRERYINPDPTSKRGLIIDLMALDPSPSVIIGRPCYHHHTKTRNCNDSKWWTSYRYSKEVIAAVGEAIFKIQHQFNKSRITLIGFSGGGTIATLLAAKLDGVVAVVGINPNLNIHAWTKLHGYSPLTGSLNPIDETKPPSHINKYYLIGLLDHNVQANSWLQYFHPVANSKIHTFEKIDHGCCWPKIWPDFLAIL